MCSYDLHQDNTGKKAPVKGAKPILEIITKHGDSVEGGFSDKPHVEPESDVIGSINESVVKRRPRSLFQHSHLVDSPWPIIKDKGRNQPSTS